MLLVIGLFTTNSKKRVLIMLKKATPKHIDYEQPYITPANCGYKKYKTNYQGHHRHQCRAHVLF